MSRNKREQPARKLVPLSGRTDNQRDYIRSIVENDVIFCTGPAGTGKSFIAAGIASEHLFHGKIGQIVVTRPLVCAGQNFGALPGELDEKVKPYLMPMEENLKYFLGLSYGSFLNKGEIRYEPLETMRGATFNNAYMILDEAQNCTIDQIKMFITRMGEGSKVLINGDIKQTDLRNRSGLEHCIERLNKVEGVAVNQLLIDDIQRNGVIGRILKALDDD